MRLTDHETLVLQALRDHGAHAGAVELATETGLPAYTVRDTLKRVCARRLARRGGPGHWGEFEITDHGRRQLTKPARRAAGAPR